MAKVIFRLSYIVLLIAVWIQFAIINYQQQETRKIAVAAAKNTPSPTPVKPLNNLELRFRSASFLMENDYLSQLILEEKIDALSAKVTTHLELSDKRYLELKNRERLMAKWIKEIADKTGVQIDLAELEKF